MRERVAKIIRKAYRLCSLPYPHIRRRRMRRAYDRFLVSHRNRRIDTSAEKVVLGVERLIDALRAAEEPAQPNSRTIKKAPAGFYGAGRERAAERRRKKMIDKMKARRWRKEHAQRIAKFGRGQDGVRAALAAWEAEHPPAPAPEEGGAS